MNRAKQIIDGTWQKERNFSPAVCTIGGRIIWLGGHGATVDSHGRYVTFQLAEVAVPRNLFRENFAADR